MQALRASILHCVADPGDDSRESAYEYFEDGLLVVDEGRIVAAGNAAHVLREIPTGTELVDYAGKLIVPGFIPTPLGEIFEYQPTLIESMICFGIWAAGLLIMTLLIKFATAVETGKLRAPETSQEDG